MDDSADSLNPWGFSSDLTRRRPSPGTGEQSNANGGTMSRAAAKRHPLASTPSPRGSTQPPDDDDEAEGEQEHELTPETSVVVHPVSPADTLSSIALRYGTDVNTILRANRLWPGDAAQMRAEIFIPLLCCKRTPPNTIIRAKAAIAGGGSSSASSTPDPSGSRSPAGRSAQLSTSVLSSREGPGAESLPSATASTATAGGIIVPLAPGFTKPTKHTNILRTGSVSAGASFSASASARRSSRETERDWKPNKWTLGGPSSSSSTTTGSRSSISETASNTASSSSHYLVDGPGSNSSAGASASGGTGDHRDVKSDEVERASSGWNDAPAPHARIARAYQGASGARKTGGHHRLLHDLAAGLPPNTGAAANWQRPINDSLPIPPPGRTGAGSLPLPQPPTSRGGGAMNGMGGGAGGRGGPPWRPPPSQQPAGLGKILSDTFRGRMSVEDAFEAAIQSVSASVTVAPPGEGSGPSGGWTSIRPPGSDGSARLRSVSPGPGVRGDGAGADGLRPQLVRSPHSATGDSHGRSPFNSLRGGMNGMAAQIPAGQPSPPGHELERLSFEASSVRAEKWEREQSLLGLGRGDGDAAREGARLHPSSAAASSTGWGRDPVGGHAGASNTGGTAGLRSRSSVRGVDWAAEGAATGGSGSTSPTPSTLSNRTLR